jgi:hypothetical protein
MDIHRNHLIRACLVLASAFLSTVAAAGNGALLGVPIQFPQINFLSLAGQGASYNLTTLQILGTPTLVTFNSGSTSEFVLGGTLTLSANIDASGTLSGGTYSISAVQVTDTSTANTYTGVLISGAVTDYGIIDTGGPGGTDLADFELTVTAGSMKGLFDAVGSTAGAVVSLEGSSFSGSFAVTWSAARAKGDFGPIPGVTPPSELPLTIGYWKNHEEAWPITNMTICGVNLDQEELLSILNTKPRGDVTIIMAHQLIASKLNVANGNSCSTVPAAEAWLCDHGGIGASIKQWDGGEPLKDQLDDFNNHDPDACP